MLADGANVIAPLGWQRAQGVLKLITLEQSAAEYVAQKIIDRGQDTSPLFTAVFAKNAEEVIRN